jgi:hypothetical protein
MDPSRDTFESRPPSAAAQRELLAANGTRVTFLGHALLFFLAGFAGYLINADRGSSFEVSLLIALPVYD